MADRVQVRDLARPRPVQVSGGSRDPYYVPNAPGVPKPGQNELVDLTKALAQIQPDLNRYLGNEAEKFTEEEIKEGAAAYARNQKAFKDAVSEGLIPEGASPWFKKGYETQAGRVAGEQEYVSGLHQAYETSGVANQDDPNAVRTFVADYTKQFLEGKGTLAKDTDWMGGFIPSSRSAGANLVAHHTSVRRAEMSRKVRENLGIEVGGLIDNEWTNQNSDPMGLTEEMKDLRATELGKVISGRAADLVRNGLHGSDANKVLIETLDAKARELRDPSILRIPITTGSGLVNNTTAFKERRTATESWLRDYENSEMRLAWALEDRQRTHVDRAWQDQERAHTLKEREEAKAENDRKKGTRSAMTDLVLDILANPARPLDAGKLQNLARLDPMAVRTVKDIRENELSIKERVIENDAWVRAQYQDMSRDAANFNVQRIFSGAASRQIDSNRMVSMLKDLRILQQEESDPVLGHKDFRTMKDRLLREIQVDIETKGVGGAEIAATDAVERLVNEARTFRKKNPQAEVPEFMIEMSKKRNELRKEFNQSGVEGAQKQPSQPASDPNAPKPSPSKSGSQQQQRQATPQKPNPVTPDVQKAHDLAVKAKDQKTLQELYREYPQLKPGWWDGFSEWWNGTR